MSERKAELALAWFLSALIVVPLLRLELVPTMDGFHHVLHGVIVNHYDDASRGYSDFLEPGAPITSLGFGWLFGPLEPLLGWRRAYMAALTTIALGWSWAVRALVHAIAGRRTPLGVVGFCFAFAWPLYMGFLPFCVSGAIGVCAMALAASRVERRLSFYVGLGGLILLSALAHVFPAVICGVSALALSMASVENPRREACLVGLVGIPSALIALLVLGTGTENIASQGATTNALFWQPWGARLGDLGATSVGGPTWRWLPLVAGALAGAAIALRRRERISRVTGVLACALLTFGLVAPLHMTAWEYLAPRTLLFALALGIAALARVLPATRDRTVLTISAGLALGSVAWAQTHNAALNQSVQGVLTGLDEERSRSGWRLPIVFDVYGGIDPDVVAYAKPLTNIAFVFAVEEGGMIPYLFASSPGIHPMVFREGLRGIEVPDRSYYNALTNPDWADPRSLDALRTSLLSTASGYQDAILIGDPGSYELVETRGFRFDHQSPTTAVIRYEGCRFDVELEAERASEGLLQWGWFPLEDEAGRTELALRASGVLETSAQLPCGNAWLRLAVRAGDQTFVCHGAAPDGRLVLEITDGMHFHCPLTPYSPPGASQ